MIYILTKREEEIYQYLKNHDNLLNTPIDNLCKDLKISYATIYSLIEKLGFKGYKDLIINITLEGNRVNNKLSDDYEKVFRANFSISINSYVNQFIEIVKNKNVVFIGKSHSNIIARKFSLDFNRLGINAMVLDNDYDQIMLAISNMDRNSVIVAITNSGKTDWILDALEEANKKEISCITITSGTSSDLDKLNKLVVRLVNGKKLSITNRVSNFIPLLIFLDIFWEKIVQSLKK